jgi:hypothetical protein
MLFELLGQRTLLRGECNDSVSLEVHRDDLKVHVVVDEVVEQLNVARNVDCHEWHHYD